MPERSPAPIICLEGVSAVGKTTLARALAAERGAAVVPELDGTGAPPVASAEPWFTERHVERWRQACALRAGAPLVVIDCDPLKGLWYNWMHAEQGWPGVDVVGPLYRDRVRRGSLAFPDLYVFLEADEAQLWARRDGDPTRTRAGFESHIRSWSRTAATSPRSRRRRRSAWPSSTRATVPRWPIAWPRWPRRFPPGLPTPIISSTG